MIIYVIKLNDGTTKYFMSESERDNQFKTYKSAIKYEIILSKRY